MSTSDAIAIIEAELSARDRRIERLEALLKGQQNANLQLLNTNLRLKAEVDAADAAIDAAREHADSLI
jgi:hypothetical protein